MSLETYDFRLTHLLISFSFAICVMSSLHGNVGDPRVNGEFPSQTASNTGFDIFYGNKTNLRIAGDLRGRGPCDVPVIEKPLLTYHSLGPLPIEI